MHSRASFALLLVSSSLFVAACGGSSASSGGSSNGGAGATGASSSASGDAKSSASSSSGALAIASSGSGGAGGASCSPACPSGLDCVNGICQGVIDFETVPGQTTPLMECEDIDTQYAASFGVTFGMDTDGDGVPDAPLKLAQVGNPEVAFSYDAEGVGDTAAPGQDIGMYFVTDDCMVAAPPPPIYITYAVPVSAAYGEIIDIDGLEAWSIEARDSSGATIDMDVLSAGDPGTGDGIATPFSFQHKEADIASLRFTFTGQGAAVGFAFDNFSPASASPPPK